MSRSPGVIGLILLSGVCAVAGNKAVTAIVVYPGTSGPAYVQAFDITINSKDEVFACPPAGTAVDTNNYKKQAKIKLATATSVERMPDGALALTSAAGTQCVVPANLKLEKNRQYKVAELAAMATLQGKFLAKSSNGDDTVPAEIKTGTYLQFVAAPDAELAEYLRASRGNTVPLLSAYLLSYPKTGHSAEARMALAKLIAAEAEQEFAAFRASPATAPDYTHLKNALERAQGAMKQVADFPRAQKVADDVRAQLTALMSSAHAELEAYQKALTEHTPGYQHLVSARAVLANVHLVDPGFTGLTLLQNDSDRRVQEVEGATGVAEGLLKSGRQDDAYATVAAFRSFRGELPRVAAVIDGAFQFHRQKADAAVTAGTWEPAIAEFKRALSYKEDADTAAALKNAETQLETIRTKQGAEQAIARSNDLAAAKQFFEAYQVLDTLPPEQRALVKDELANLQKPYTDELLKRSDALLHVHLPIRGRADEDGARTAQQYLSQATELLHEDLVQVKLDLVNESIAEYYLDLGNKQYGKPRGLGSGLGWMFWKEAQRFKPDLPALRDQMTKFAPQYDTRAKLSVAVHVRDHTSRRDSLGYADQVADTIAAAIDNASLPGVKVVSRRDATVDTNDPNSYLPTMVLTGDILNHRVDRTVDTQGLTSHYRAGRREVKNPAWVAAKETYDNLKAQLDQLRDVQVARAGTMKKKELMETQRQSDALATKLTDAKKQMDAVPETLLEDIIVPYNYTRHTIHLDAVVEIGFQLADPEDEAIKDAGTVKIDQPTSVVVLESVKSEDVDGVIASGAAPDDDQLLGAAERAAQASLVTEVVKKVRDLPPRVLADARARAARNDLEGAAERYILYLNSTPKGDTPERKEALDFLTRQFNLTAVLTPAMVGR